jgi:acyl dehydratase
MPIDIDRALGAELPDRRSSWDATDVILYHLGLGAGVPPTDPAEIAYTFEDGLTVLPSFGVIPAVPMLMDMLEVPGMDVDLARLLHGEQDLEIHGVLPAAATVRTSATITDIYDKGSGALVVLETLTRDAETEQLLATNRFSAFVRGEGGFGRGSDNPSRPPMVRPSRPPDHQVECPTLPQQALLYRLSGDMNPIHANPEFARRGGFDQPILHGLCSYGMVCKAVVDTVLGGDTARVSRYRGRFAGVVYPGETIVAQMWREGTTVFVEALSKERNTPVLTQATVEIR